MFNKTSERIAWLVNKTWLSRYPRCCYIIYDNGSEFKLNFEYLCICHMPPSYVPYKGTYVPYDGTFGAPDQGQMLDV
jgi:hypothetical protein